MVGKIPFHRKTRPKFGIHQKMTYSVIKLTKKRFIGRFARITLQIFNL